MFVGVPDVITQMYLLCCRPQQTPQKQHPQVQTNAKVLTQLSAGQR